MHLGAGVDLPHTQPRPGQAYCRPLQCTNSAGVREPSAPPQRILSRRTGPGASPPGRAIMATTQSLCTGVGAAQKGVGVEQEDSPEAAACGLRFGGGGHSRPREQHVQRCGVCRQLRTPETAFSEANPERRGTSVPELSRVWIERPKRPEHGSDHRGRRTPAQSREALSDPKNVLPSPLFL